MMPEAAGRGNWLRPESVLLMALVGVFVWIAGDVLLLVFAGVLLAVGLDGLSTALVRHIPLARGWALAITGTMLLALLGVIGWVVVPQFLGQLDDLWERMAGLVDQLREPLENHDWASRLLNDSQEQGRLADAAGAAMQHAATAGLAVVGVAGSLVVLIAIALFAAADPALYRRGFLLLLPAPRRARVEAALLESARGLRWWFLGQLISMLLLGVSVSAGLKLIGVDLWLSLGVLTALLTFIPFLGPIIAGVPIVIIGFAEGVQTGLIVLAFYVVVQNLEGNFFVPMIQHRVVNLAPALLISVQVLMGTLFGPLGLIMAAPITVVGMILVKKLYVESSSDSSATSFGNGAGNARRR
jgi:predicted PurR-regulated permease PerM